HEIRHLVGIKASPSKVYEALTTAKGVARWWTTDVRGDGTHKGGRLEMRFEGNLLAVGVKDLRKDKVVVWKTTTTDYPFAGVVRFELKKKGSETLVHFSHTGVPKGFHGDFLSTKWATFLLSMKDSIEKGRGRPFPRDVHVMHGDVG